MALIATSIRLDTETNQCIENLAIIHDLSKNEVIRILIECGLPRFDAWIKRRLTEKRKVTQGVLKQLSMIDQLSNSEIQEKVK